MIDLRSDTVTRPTAAMRTAMLEAAVGDDVFGEDQTMNAFEEKIAAMFGMDAGLFVPSGTMSNQISLHLLSEPGDEILIESTGHIFNYEASAASWLSSVQLNPLTGMAGKIDPGSVENHLRGGHDWEPTPKVIAIENSTNKGGGACYTRQELLSIHQLARENNLKLHLDGARIWNALLEVDYESSWLGSIADTISVCFSKGLGAPVGSMILSGQETIRKARQVRKRLGGGMRQIGMLAAAADYAVEHHWPLLREDHRRAREMAKVIDQCSRLSIDLERVQTNILIFDTLAEDAVSALKKLADDEIQMVPFGENTIRATFHHHITNDDLEQVNASLKKHFQ